MEKNILFETMNPGRALTIMALPTVISQMIVLLYNLADTWFIGRTNNPYMIGASSLALTVFLAATALSNVFGVGGGSLMARLIGQKKLDAARGVVSYTLSAAFISAAAFSLIILFSVNPLLKLLGASSNTIVYAKQYILTTTVIGGIPTILSMAMSQLLRNAGYSKEAGIGVGFGSLLNILLDPIFMFVILPDGYEVLGAGIATMISNYICFMYFIIMYRKVRDRTVLVIPHRLANISREHKSSLYSVGIPAAVAIFLFDLVTIVTNRLTASYGDIPLAAMGIVLKIERIPVNIGLGICLGMVPLVAYNYGSGNFDRMREFLSLAAKTVLSFSCACATIFWLLAPQCIELFISDTATVTQGAEFLRGRCLALPFMMAGYLIVNYMNAVNRGKISFLIAVIRHIVIIIPVMLLMNHIWGMTGLIWSQLTSDILSTMIALLIFRRVNREIMSEKTQQH